MHFMIKATILAQRPIYYEQIWMWSHCPTAFPLPFSKMTASRHKKNTQKLDKVYYWKIFIECFKSRYAKQFLVIFWVMLILIDISKLIADEMATRKPMIKWGCPRSVMVKVMDCGIVVSEFVLQSRHYVHLRAHTLRKGMNPFILLAMG